MYDQRFIFIEGDHPCIYDKVGKRKYFLNDDLCEKLNSLWKQTLRFEGYSKKSNHYLDCLERAMEKVFEKPNPTIDKIIKIYNDLKEDSKDGG